MHPHSEGTFSMPSSHTPSALVVAFDDHHAVANAGLALTATLAERLGVEAVVDELVDLGDRPGHHRPGRKVLTLLHAMVAGGDVIDDADVLRTARTQELLGHRVMAPSTLGTFLRSFTFGHIRQLDRVAETLLARAWAAGAGPGDQELTIDVDSTVCEVHGHAKGGAAYGYTRRLGYHPLLASRADTGELLHLRMRTGSANTARGAERFVNELAGRVRRAGARGPLTLRGDSGFWSGKVIGACRRHGIGFSITVRQTKLVKAAIAAIGEDAWTDIDYPDGGAAQVAETTLAGKAGGRLIVRRTRLVGAQATLWPNWRHHAFITDRAGTAVWLDADHRRHAVVELAIVSGTEEATSGLGPRWVRVAAVADGHQRSPTGRGETAGRRPSSSGSWDDASGRFGWWSRRSTRGGQHLGLYERTSMSPPTDRSIVTTAAEPRPRRTTDARGVAMPGQPAHFEIPADDTAKGRQFWGSLFDWQFEAMPGPFEYHMTRISDQVGVAVTNMEPGKRGIRTYFYVDDINAGAARVQALGGEANDPGSVPGMGWFATCRDPEGNELGLWQNDPSAPAPTG